MGTKTQHTPDWQLNQHRYPNGTNAYRPFIFDNNAPEGSRHVCEMFDEPGPARDKRGLLIAAAPDLLEACELALCEMNLAISLTKPHTRERKSFEAMKAALLTAINKAQGT